MNELHAWFLATQFSLALAYSRLPFVGPDLRQYFKGECRAYLLTFRTFCAPKLTPKLRKEIGQVIRTGVGACPVKGGAK